MIDVGNKLKFLESIQDKEKQLDIINNFHGLYYYSSYFGKTWKNTTWMGHDIQKCPLDLWLYQEILYGTKPKIIIETGTGSGASSFYLAQMSEIMHLSNIVVTIDVHKNYNKPSHAKIKSLIGDSTSPEIIKQVDNLVQEYGRGMGGMVILDSDHKTEHVKKEMELYKKYVGIGCFMIVEDSNIGGNPVLNEKEKGPMPAIENFIKYHQNEFKIMDDFGRKFYMTFNPKGYIRRIL